MSDVMGSADDYGRLERKYEVFLSSTYKDMENLRASLIFETSRLGHIASGMEFFVGGPNIDESINSAIGSADIFVILIGASLGTLVPLSETDHYIQREYEIAVKLGKPTLVYLLEEEESSSLRSKIPIGHPERKLDGELSRFLDKVKHDSKGAAKGVGVFSLHNEAKLLAEYGRDLRRVVDDLKHNSVGGWIRAEEYDKIRTVSSNRFFRRFVSELNQFDTLSARITQPGSEEKISIAKYFLDHYLARMFRKGVRRFFFESGSSIAFLSEYFIDFLDNSNKTWLIKRASELELHTNNILTYIDFTLRKEIHIELFPYGKPEKKYGATFGQLSLIPDPPAPQEGEFYREEDAEVVEIVSKMAEKLASLYKENGVILMTASGLEKAADHPFYGPHVGSYYNMLFKRALLSTGCPTVLFLDDKKLLKSPFTWKQCFPVCDKDQLNWDSICHNTPLAVAVGCESRIARDECETLLIGMGLTKIDTLPDRSQNWSIIASNDRFAKFMAGAPQLSQAEQASVTFPRSL